MRDLPARAIPWGLLARLGEGTISEEEVGALTPMLLAEPVEPPNWFITRAAALPHQERMRAQPPDFFTRLVASLTFDSAQQPAFAAVRGGAAGGSRRLVYETERLTVLIELAADEDGGVTVSGQLTSNEPSSRAFIELEAESAAEGSINTTSNEFGYFTMQHVRSGTYRLIIHGEEEEIEIRSLPV